MAEPAAQRIPQNSSARPRTATVPSSGPGAGTAQQRSRWSVLAMLIGGRKGSMGTLALVSVTAALCEASILAIAARAATALVRNSDRTGGGFGPLHLNLSTTELLYAGGGLALVRLLLQAPTSYLPARIAGDLQAAMRTGLMRAYLAASWEKQSQDREGHFQEMMSNQIQQASAGALQITQLIVAACTFMILVLGAFALDPVAAGVVFLAAGAAFAALRPASARAMGLSRRLSAAQLEYAGAVGEANRMAEETKVFGVAEPQREGIGHFVAVSRGLFVRAQALARAVPNVYQSLIYLILIAGLLAISLSRISHFAQLGAVVLLLVRAGSYGQQVQTFWVSLRQSLPFAERLQHTIDAYAESTRIRGDARLERIQSLAFEDVTYFYRPDRPVLQDVSFAITRGEMIGIVGPSGAGKSTIVQILLSLREPRSGRFLINGLDAIQFRLADLPERISYVPQQPQLLHGTVADNVRFHRPYDQAAVERACRLARIHDEIMGWPAGYATIVGPRADAVSGGQQQRICLARALVSDPSVLVLDEPTSALDPRSEALIQQSLDALRHELTLFIVAHRMSTLTICDRVMVVRDGTLDAFATVQELRDTNDYFRFASEFASAATVPGRLQAGHAEAEAEPGGAFGVDNGVVAERRLSPHKLEVRDEPLFIFSAGWPHDSASLHRLVVSAGRHFAAAAPSLPAESVRRLAASLPSAAEGQLIEAHRARLRQLLAPSPTQAELPASLHFVDLSADYGLYLRLLFPRARFLFLVRDPLAAYRSYSDHPTAFERWPRSQIRAPYAYGRRWRRLTESFIAHEHALDAPLIRYEDLVPGSGAIDTLDQVLRAPVDRSMIEPALPDPLPPRRGSLSSLEIATLGRATQPLAARLGYAGTGEPDRG